MGGHLEHSCIACRARQSAFPVAPHHTASLHTHRLTGYTEGMNTLSVGALLLLVALTAVSAIELKFKTVDELLALDEYSKREFVLNMRMYPSCKARQTREAPGWPLSSSITKRRR